MKARYFGVNVFEQGGNVHLGILPNQCSYVLLPQPIQLLMGQAQPHCSPLRRRGMEAGENILGDRPRPSPCHNVGDKFMDTRFKKEIGWLVLALLLVVVVAHFLNGDFHLPTKPEPVMVVCHPDDTYSCREVNP